MMALLNKMRNNLGLIACYLAIFAAIAMVIYPTLWVVSSALNPGTSLSTSGGLIPANPTLENFEQLLFGDKYPYLQWYVNTLKVCTIASLLSVVLTAGTAYAFSKFRFKGRKHGLMFLLVIQMFPIMLMMTAIYVILNIFGLLDTHTGLILAYLGGYIPFSSWMIKGYFDGIPNSLSDAALVDGASRFQIFWKIMLPLAKPILAVVMMFNFINTFKDFVLARIILKNPQKLTLAVGLRNMVTNDFANNWPLFAAGAVLAAIPVVIVFLYFQEYFISGLTAGATKG